MSFDYEIWNSSIYFFIQLANTFQNFDPAIHFLEWSSLLSHSLADAFQIIEPGTSFLNFQNPFTRALISTFQIFNSGTGFIQLRSSLI